METSKTFKKYLGRFGYALDEMYQAMDDILSDANDDYENGNITIVQLALIAKMVCYFESIKPFEQ